jgi:hypothetical protein
MKLLLDQASFISVFPRSRPGGALIGICFSAALAAGVRVDPELAFWDVVDPAYHRLEGAFRYVVIPTAAQQQFFRLSPE